MRILKEKKGLYLIALNILLPSFIYVAANAPSMAYGVFIVCLITLFSFKIKVPRDIFKGTFFPFLLGMIVLQLIYILINSPELKEMASLFFLLVLICSSATMAYGLLDIDDFTFLNWTKKLCSIFIILGLFSLFFKISILGYEKFGKSVFPFSEPSHFLISTSSILFFTGFFLKPIWKFIFLSLLLLQAIFYPSLIMLFLIGFMVIFYYLRKPFKFLVAAVLLATLLSFLLDSLGVSSYFLDRLNFSGDSSNITALVYMQGWEDAYIALIETNGFGLGFQKMGSIDAGQYGEMIFHILGEYKNREDGGFLAAKIIGEFGIFGLLILMWYSRMFIHSSLKLLEFVKIEYIQPLNDRNNLTRIFGHSLIVVFFLELFVRGYGYFSPGVFMFFVGYFLLKLSYFKNNVQNR